MKEEYPKEFIEALKYDLAQDKKRLKQLDEYLEIMGINQPTE